LILFAGGFRGRLSEERSPACCLVRFCGAMRRGGSGAWYGRDRGCLMQVAMVAFELWAGAVEGGAGKPQANHSSPQGGFKLGSYLTNHHIPDRGSGPVPGRNLAAAGLFGSPRHVMSRRMLLIEGATSGPSKT
jgi:hypothetical protein